MTRFRKYLLFAVTLLAQSYGDTFEGMSPADIENLRQKIASALEEDIERTSQRKGVSLEVEVEQSEESIRFSLSLRSQRDTWFSLTITPKNDHSIVEGCLRHPEQIQPMEALISDFLKARRIEWQWQTGELYVGLVCVPCADLYVEPRKEAGDNLASQLLYGTPVLLLEATEDKKFYLVEGQLDGYLGWMAAECLKGIPKNTWIEWVHAPKYYLPVSFKNFYPGTPMLLSEKRPDDGVAVPLNPYNPTGESIARTARRFLPEGDLGPIQYLWGGTCVPYLDCSGFVQIVFRLNGVLLPRDADQQCEYSRPVLKEEMQAGDLIFFSRHGQHPTHVGIYLQDGLYIHCSPSGPNNGVKINDLNGDTDYEKYLRDIYYGAGRVP